MPRILPHCVPLEDRTAPAALFATGADAGGGPHVKVFDSATGQQQFSFFAYDSAFTGGVRVAVGDVTGDGQPDIVTAPGAGGGPHIKVFDGNTGGLVREFMAYDPAFRGGAFVDVADVNGDGRVDVITGPGAGGGPHVKVFSGTDNAVLKSFLAFPRPTGMTDAVYYSGITVAGGDMNGDGFAELVAGSGPGRYSQALAYDGKTDVLVVDLQPIFGGFFGGVYVACGDVNGDSKADMAISLGAGAMRDGNSTVYVHAWGGFPTQLVAGVFNIYDSSFQGGVRVALTDVDGDGVSEIVTSPGPGGGPHVKVFSHVNSQAVVVQNFMAYDPLFLGGVFVG